MKILRLQGFLKPGGWHIFANFELQKQFSKFEGIPFITLQISTHIENDTMLCWSYTYQSLGTKSSQKGGIILIIFQPIVWYMERSIDSEFVTFDFFFFLPRNIWHWKRQVAGKYTICFVYGYLPTLWEAHIFTVQGIFLKHGTGLKKMCLS